MTFKGPFQHKPFYGSMEAAKPWLDWGCEEVPRRSMGCKWTWAVTNFLVAVL